MRRSTVLLVPLLLSLAACHTDVKTGDDAGGNSLIAIKDDGAGGDKISLNVPGFSANVALPKLDLGSHVELDGIRMAPNTKVASLDVAAQDQGQGNEDGAVRLGFTNPGTPTSLIDHYARSATAAGFAGVVRTGNSMTAHKGNKTFKLTIAPDGSGSRGTIAMAGRG